MAATILAYDLGTGGCKAALYDLDGRCLAENFCAYPTFYPHPGWHEQKPSDWWEAVVQSTRALLAASRVNPAEIACLGISGQSLGVVPLGRNGQLLRPSVPIWSDGRAAQQAEEFFHHLPEADWYRLTGNGFPPHLYSVFKILWYRHHEPALFEHIHRLLGSKDYINFLLTGRMATDHSYASGSGIYDLTGWGYSDRLLAASGLPAEIFPEILPSTTVLGTLTVDAAAALGLPRSVKVAAGGVDNSCMALGARNLRDGQIYNSQGSSSWIAVTSSKPLIDLHFRPFVFTAVLPGLYNSAVSVFSSGSSFRWVRDQLCPDLVAEAQRDGKDVYDLMTALAATSPPGARGLLFNPSLGGGTSMDGSPAIRGAFLGLDLSHTRADLIRATMEGIALELRMALDGLRQMTTVSDEMLVVGGGSRSSLWRQIFADVYSMRIVKTNIDQQAAALGAAALAAVGAGLWPDFEIVEKIHQVQEIITPRAENAALYERMLPVYVQSVTSLAALGEKIAALHIS
jgi:xylulokinase